MSNVRIELADIIPVKVRLFSIVTGCFSATVGTLAFGRLFAVVPAFLVLGAIIQPRSPLPGKWLMWVGAFLPSLVVLPIAAGTVFGGLRALRSYHDASLTMTFSLALASILLVLGCDAMLVIDGVTLRHKDGEPTRSRKRGVTPLVWIAALVLTVYLLVMSMSAFHAYRVYGRLDVLLTWAALSLVVLSFDVALLVRAAKQSA